MSNLGGYQLLTTFAKKVGGPRNLVALIAGGGAIIGGLAVKGGERLWNKVKSKQDLVEPVLPTASSPLPAIVKCKDEETELEWIVETAIRMSGNQSIAILVRNRELVDLVEEKLRTKKIIPQILKNRMGVLDLNAKISIGTFHSAKGLEFDMVFLPFCSVKYLPSEERILANEGRDEALKEEAKLLYVAITRAKRGLILSYTAEKTELLLEVDESLYDERELK